MKPFLLLATRAEDRAAAEEYDAFLRFSGLSPHELVRVRLEQAPLAELVPGLDLDDWSGIVLGGSPFTTSDAVKSEVQVRVEDELGLLLREVVRRDHPFLGACYGIGTLGIVEGALVDGTYAEPVGAVEVKLTAEGHDDPLLGVLPGEFEAFVGHKEGITQPAAHMVVLAGSATCPVQAFRIGRRVYATQFHPELDVPGIRTRIDLYRHAGYFPAETAEQLMSAAAQSRVHAPPLLLRRFVELFAAH